MRLLDLIGLVGVAIMLAAYAGAASGRYAANSALPLLANLGGAILVLVSMIGAFNLAAFAMETSWALVALAGLARLILMRAPKTENRFSEKTRLKTKG